MKDSRDESSIFVGVYANARTWTHFSVQAHVCARTSVGSVK